MEENNFNPLSIISGGFRTKTLAAGVTYDANTDYSASDGYVMGFQCGETDTTFSIVDDKTGNDIRERLGVLLTQKARYPLQHDNIEIGKILADKEIQLIFQYKNV